MVGCIVLGGLATLAFVRLWHWRRHGGWYARRWRHWHGYGYGPGAGSPDPDGGDPFGPDFGGFGRRRGMGFAVHFLSDRLDATPAQEKVIAESLGELRAEVEPLRQEARKTRADVATALRRPSLDEVLFGELFARHDEALEKARKAFMGTVGKIHDALDEKQRERLADLVERGPRFFGRGGAW